MSGKILVVYYHNIGYPLRATLADLLYCFDRYSGHLCYYVNAAFGIPGYLRKVDFDLIIYQDAFLSKRWLPKRFRTMMRRCQALKAFKGVKVALPQDEFIYTDMLNQFINDFGIQHIFSVAPETEWEKIYPDVDRGKVSFETILTGYLEDRTVDAINKLAAENGQRDIDIGYRATPLSFWIGRHGHLKERIAHIVGRSAPQFNLTTDISVDPKDTFLGLDWYRFMLRCKYFLGVESGASLLDRDGRIRRQVEDYLVEFPHASFEEVERACFEGLDGQLGLSVMGPRHLEACATKTCQILVEGSYNGILKPGEHYVELKKDFSNLDDVLAIVKDDQQREAIVERAYTDIVSDGRWTYRALVEQVLRRCSQNDLIWSQITPQEERIHRLNNWREKLIWLYIPVRAYFVDLFLSLLSPSLFRKLTRFYD